MTSSGQCSCNTGYSGVDCGKCSLGYSREGLRCILASEFSRCLCWCLLWQSSFGLSLYSCHGTLEESKKGLFAGAAQMD